MRINLDLDGVCYAWDKTARYMLRRKLAQEGRPIPVELFSPSPHWHSIEEVVEPADWEWLWDEGVDLGLFRYGHCITGAIEGTEVLGRLGELRIVTARPHRAIQDTYDWIGFMFNRANILDVVFTDDKHEVDADVYVDDAPHHAVKLHGMGKKIIVFQQPWNNCIAPDCGIQVSGWPAVVQAVRAL